jgi:hypothetical protein
MKIRLLEIDTYHFLGGKTITSLLGTFWSEQLKKENKIVVVVLELL